MSRDYEAGYRDGSIHYELEHCPACKNVADLQKALADNDKLWDLNEHMRLKDMSIIGGLEEENAKLRRLLHLIFNEDYNDEFVELMCDLRIEETTND